MVRWGDGAPASSFGPLCLYLPNPLDINQGAWAPYNRMAPDQAPVITPVLVVAVAVACATESTGQLSSRQLEVSCRSCSYEGREEGEVFDHEPLYYLNVRWPIHRQGFHTCKILNCVNALQRQVDVTNMHNIVFLNNRLSSSHVNFL